MTKSITKAVLWLCFWPFILTWKFCKFLGWLAFGRRKPKPVKMDLSIKEPEPRNLAPIPTRPTSLQKFLVTSSIGRNDKEPSRNKKPGRWVPLAASVNQGKVTLSRGGVYVGGHLPREDGYGQENCLIDPTLQVGDPVVGIAPTIGYWPRYKDLGPAERRIFLDWLNKGRDDPHIDMGFVFIYFYGLERRLILDDPGEEEQEIVNEIHRLRAVYGQNRSFNQYSSALLDVVSARRIYAGDPAAGLQMPRSLAKPYEQTWSLTASLLQAVRQNLSVLPVETALTWVLSEADVATPAVTRRNPQKVVEHFCALYSEFVASSNGLRLRPRTALALRFRSSSGSFSRAFAEVTGDVKGLDPLKDGRSLRKLANVFDRAVEEMVPFLKTFEKLDAGEATLEVLSRLPLAQRQSITHPNTEFIVKWMNPALRDDERPTLDDLVDALGINATKAPSTVEARKCAETLERFGYGVMPDPRFSVLRPRPADVFVLFELKAPQEAVTEPSAEFSAAIVRQTLSATMAAADGHIDEREIAELKTHLANAPVRGDEKARLAANLEALLVSPPTWSKIRAKVKALPQALHEGLLLEAVAIAAADGVMERSEMQLLEKIADSLAIPRQSLYSLVSNAAAADRNDDLSPVTIPRPGSKATSAPDGYDIPSHQPIRLDPKKLDQIKNDTRASKDILIEVFDDVANAEAIAEDIDDDIDDDIDKDLRKRQAREGPDASQSRSLPAGSLGTFLERLLEREAWPLTEVSDIAAGLGLSSMIAIEDVNDWATKNFGELILLIEGDDLEVDAIPLKES